MLKITFTHKVLLLKRNVCFEIEFFTLAAKFRICLIFQTSALNLCTTSFGKSKTWGISLWLMWYSRFKRKYSGSAEILIWFTNSQMVSSKTILKPFLLNQGLIAFGEYWTFSLHLALAFSPLAPLAFTNYKLSWLQFCLRLRKKWRQKLPLVGTIP